MKNKEDLNPVCLFAVLIRKKDLNQAKDHFPVGTPYICQYLRESEINSDANNMSLEAWRKYCDVIANMFCRRVKKEGFL